MRRRTAEAARAWIAEAAEQLADEMRACSPREVPCAQCVVRYEIVLSLREALRVMDLDVSKDGALTRRVGR